MIQIKSYPVTNIEITKKLLSVYINQFWKDIFSPIKNNKHLWLMVKVHYSDYGYKTLGHLRKVNFTDKELFINYLSERLNILIDNYTSQSISNITFSYVINEGSAEDTKRFLDDISNKASTTHRFNNYQLPISMNPSDYGKLLSNSIIEGVNRFIVQNGSRTYKIDASLDGLTNNVTILGASEFKWMDTALTEGFKREIGKSTIYFLDGEIVNRKQTLNRKFFRNLSPDKNLSKNFITMDIETIKHDCKQLPYLICAYNGSTSISSYGEMINGLVNQKALFNSFINQLFTFFTKKSNKSLIVYAHNLSGFDGIFLMKHLLSFGKVEPLLHNGKIISIKVKLNVVGYMNKTIIFKDSMLLLPLGLRKLCAAFNITMPKGYFPFKLTDIFYKGLFPKFEYWTGISMSEYETLLNKYTGGTWSFKDESIKYCQLDCIALHQVLIKFTTLIFSHFNIDAHKTLTLPSLAMKIYKAN